MAEAAGVGVTTAELDEIGARVLRENGARSAPQLVYNFPGATCISINHEAAHGIPGERVIEAGDLVNLDVSAELDGYFADAALMLAIPPAPPLKHNLVHCTRLALEKAIQAARAGQPINAIGRAIEEQATRCGFSTLRDLGGHGVGRTIHEEPHHVPCYDNPRDQRILQEGMVLTIEPFLTTGARSVYTEPSNGWTLMTSDGSLSAQFEHTLVITKGRPVIITA
jgi:methionyl aminopeptidase